MTGSEFSYTNTPFDLRGKVALVSGGAGLLGSEFSKALYSAGADVVCADINNEILQKVKQDITGIPGNGVFETCVLNVTDKTSNANCVDTVEKEFGTIDILVNSAAIDPKFDKDSDASGFTEFTNFPVELWKESLEVNLTGCFLLTQQVCRVMEKHRKGSIINLGSNYGLVGPDQRIYKKKGQPIQSFKPADYSVCKSGIIGFTNYLAAYYAGTGIRVNVLTPSGVFNNHDDEFVKNYAANTILRRMSDKNEYWGSIIFLASEASSYMTGANLIVDGGWTTL